MSRTLRRALAVTSSVPFSFSMNLIISYFSLSSVATEQVATRRPRAERRQHDSDCYVIGALRAGARSPNRYQFIQ